MKRHYDTLHTHKSEKYEKNEVKNVMQNLKIKQEKQVDTIFNFVNDQRSSFAASSQSKKKHGKSTAV